MRCVDWSSTRDMQNRSHQPTIQSGRWRSIFKLDYCTGIHFAFNKCFYDLSTALMRSLIQTKNLCARRTGKIREGTKSVVSIPVHISRLGALAMPIRMQEPKSVSITMSPTPWGCQKVCHFITSTRALQQRTLAFARTL